MVFSNASSQQTASTEGKYPKSLNVASSNSFPPINMLDKNGELTGFGRDLSDAVLNSLEIKVNRRHSAIWTDVIDWLDKGEIDLIHDTGYTEDREKYLDYTVPIIEMPEMIFVRSERLDINTLDSLNGKVVACVNKHITHLYLQQFPNIKCHIVYKPIEGLYALIGGTVDAFVYPREIVMYFAQQLHISDKVKMVGDPLRFLSWSMTVKDGNAQLVKQLNEGIARVRASGEYEEIYNKWFGKRLLAGYTESEVRIIVIAVIVLSLFLGVSIVLLMSNRRISHAKQALEQSEKKYTEIAASVPGAVFQINKYGDQDCQLEFISQGIANTIGVQSRELLGNLQNFMRHVHVDDRERFKNSLLTSVVNKSLWQMEFRVESVAQEVSWFRVTSFPKTSGDNVLVYNGILLNISDVKELQQRQDRFFELSNNMLCIAGFDGYFKMLNPSWQTTFGYSLQELSSKPFIDFVHPDDQAKTIAESLKLAERKGQTLGFENRYRCKNGDYRHLFWMAVASPYADEIYAAAHDITELKNAEEKLHLAYDKLEERVEQRTAELQATNTHLRHEVEQRHLAEQAMQEAKEEAERANQAKSEFLSRMSHELRTPLNAVLGFSQLLETDPELKGSEHVEFAQEIYKAGSHLLDLINEVLDLSKVEAGHLNLCMEAIELNCLIDECLVLIRPLADAREIKIIHKKNVTTPLAYTDGMRMKQVLLNIMSNAVKYNRHAGTITVEYAIADNGMIRCSVTDTGQGLSKSEQMNLFQPFNRLGAENSEIEGTGIGLVITKKLVELMGGELTLDSEPGKGTCFTITLALADADLSVDNHTYKNKRADISSNILSLDKSCVVLYIEDNQANLRLVKSALAKISGIKLLTEISAENGFKRIAIERPDLILMDINLPGMDGMEAMQYLQGKADTMDIPVIAVTADVFPESVKRGLHAGFKDYLIKPIDIRKLQTLVIDVLSSDSKKAASN